MRRILHCRILEVTAPLFLSDPYISGTLLQALLKWQWLQKSSASRDDDDSFHLSSQLACCCFDGLCSKLRIIWVRSKLLIVFWSLLTHVSNQLLMKCTTFLRQEKAFDQGWKHQKKAARVTKAQSLKITTQSLVFL